MFKNIITKLILTVLLVLPLVFPNLTFAETIPNAPTGFNATGKPGYIELVWQDNSSNEDIFTVWRKPNGGSWSQIASLATNTTSYNDTSMNIGVLYYYVVRAENEAGFSAWSNSDSATALQPGDPPVAPTVLSATAVSTNQIDLAWTDNSNNENGFRIERSLNPTSGFAQVATVGAGNITYQDTGLLPATTYYYRVAAYNGSGDSGWSNTATVTTPSETRIPMGFVRDVVTDGSYAYLASYDAGLVIVDVRNPPSPRGIASLDVGFPPLSIQAEGSLVAVAGGLAGVALIDVSSPTAPIQVSMLRVSASKLAIQGRYAYLSDKDGYLRIADLSNPNSPNIVAELQVEGRPQEVVVVGNYAYLVVNTKLLVIDVSSPNSPSVVGTLERPAQLVAVANANNGLRAYIDSVDYGGIEVIDVSDPAQLGVLGEHFVGARLMKLVARGDMLYATFNDWWGSAKGLRIIDVSDSSNPITTAVELTGGGAYGLDVWGDYAYVADGSAGLKILDIRDSYNPFLVSTLTYITPQPMLTLQKTADRQEVLRNQYITYTISYTNNHQTDLSQVIIEDQLDLANLDPSSVQFLSGNGACDSGACNSSSTKVIFDIGNVASGGTGSVSFKVRVR